MQAIFTFLATLSFWALTIYEWVIIIAILVSWVNPDPRNPIVQFLRNMTYPFWDYLGRTLPPSLRLFSAYFSLMAVWFLIIFVPGIFNTLAAFSLAPFSADAIPVEVAAARAVGFFLLGAGIVARSFLGFLMLLLVVWFFLTLISPSVNNPIVRVLFVLVDPFITPIQKRLPRSRIDISPLLAAGVFLLLNVLLVSELIAFSASLSHYLPRGA